MPSKKILAKKQAFVKNLAQELEGAESVVFSNYQGLSVEQDTKMRRAFREENLYYRVVKNTQALRAFAQLGITGLEDILKGPTALAWSKEDVTLAPRLVKKFADEFRKTQIKGGILDGELSTLDTIIALANIPATEVLYGQLVSSMLFPITSLAMTLNALYEKATEEGKENVADMASAAASTAEAVEQENTETSKEAAATEENAADTASHHEE